MNQKIQLHLTSRDPILKRIIEVLPSPVLTTDNFPAFEKKGIELIKLSLSHRKYETIGWIADFFEQYTYD